MSSKSRKYKVALRAKLRKDKLIKELAELTVKMFNPLDMKFPLSILLETQESKQNDKDKQYEWNVMGRGMKYRNDDKNKIYIGGTE